MKKFAIFLPQFHTFPENDEWWGKGFTEWVKVKNAKSLYNGHVQPQEPLDGNYYNLLDKDVMIWHSELLKKYKIDGFAYYHYYFCGKLLMETPAENLLKWTDIDQKFFFYWANHSWNRAWEGKRTLLIEQTYGSESEWEKHFQYLLKFFKDERYEKVDNKPVFAIFNTFSEEKEMLSYFNRRCIEEGFSGIYVIQTLSDGTNYPDSFDVLLTHIPAEVASAIYIREPNFAQTYSEHLTKNISIHNICAAERKIRAVIGQKTKNGLWIKKYNGNKLLNRISHIKFDDKQTTIIPGIFFQWDNTPRHEYRGYIITPIDKTHFMSEMDKAANAPCILINAWNEWAEGMMLEPTGENEYKYLEWIQEWSQKHEE